MKTEVKFQKPIKVKGKEVSSVEVRIPTVGDDLAAGAASRFQTPLGHMQVDEILKEVHIISAVSGIAKSDLEGLSRVEYALISEAVGKLEQNALLPPVTKSEDSK